MRVLVGVDESKHADTTLNFMLGLPWPEGTRVLLVSAVQIPVPVYAGTYAPVAMDMGLVLEELTKLHQQVVARAEKKLSTARLVVETRVAQGDPREALIEEAQAFRADLVVVGSHGRTGLTKLMMGSVATHIVTHAPCSVLVVRSAGAARKDGS